MDQKDINKDDLVREVRTLHQRILWLENKLWEKEGCHRKIIDEQAEEKLKPSEEKHRSIVENAVQGIMQDITARKAADENTKKDADQIRKYLLGTINALSMMVETRDPFTSGHQKRVSRLARAIAQDMALSHDTINNIRIAGIIHDIGKVSVPAGILGKTSKLTDMEFDLIKVHSQSGYHILKEAELPYPIAETVLQHHERLNGSGYPQGLKGEQILLESKIIAVADVVEAMASHRPHRPALGIEVALEEIEKNAGILYDKRVAKVSSSLFKEKGFRFE